MLPTPPRALLPAFAACALTAAAWGGSDTVHSFPRVASYEIEATFDPERSAMSGSARVTFAPDAVFGNELVFHLHGELWVDEVLVDGVAPEGRQERVYYASDYSLVANEVTLALGGPVKEGVSISYSGYLHPSRARTPSDYMRVNEDGVLLRSYGYSVWFPVFLPESSEDYAVDFTRVSIDVPAELHAVFVGERLDERVVASESGERRISEWRVLGLSIMDAQCTARRYTILDEENVRVYHEQDETSAAVGRQVLGFAGELAGAFREEYGEPAITTGIHVMQMPEFGDIADANVIGLSERNWRGFNRGMWGRRTLAHELVHAFVDIRVRRDDPLYALVVEGFPSYFHLPILGELAGPGVYAGWMQETESGYLRRRETGVDHRGNALPVERPLLELGADDIGTYKDKFVLNDRSRLFLNWLRHLLGVDGFRAFTLELFAHEEIDAPGFERLVLQYLGEEAADDLRLWLHTSEYPERLRLAAQDEGGY